MTEGGGGEQERTQEPSAKRLQEAREHGKVPRSRELATAATFAAGILAIWGIGPWMAKDALAWMHRSLLWDSTLLGDAGRLPAVVASLLAGLVSVVLPLVLICMMAGFLAPILVGGLLLSAKALTPDFTRLNPLAGIKRLYGREALAELGRSLLRVGLIVLAGTFFARYAWTGLLALIEQPLNSAVADGFGLALRALLALTGVLVFLAAVDVPYQLWSYRRSLRMTREELRQELKESEGSPEIKARIRRTQQALAQRRMMDAVPAADVVVVNPTHFAVALMYQSGKMRAPRVVAKGVDRIAATIREVAERNRVAIVSSPALARTLYRQVEIGREIPATLYAAVAQILTYVYHLRVHRRQGGIPPEPPTVDIPGA